MLKSLNSHGWQRCPEKNKILDIYGVQEYIPIYTHTAIVVYQLSKLYISVCNCTWYLHHLPRTCLRPEGENRLGASTWYLHHLPRTCLRPEGENRLGASTWYLHHLPRTCLRPEGENRLGASTWYLHHLPRTCLRPEGQCRLGTLNVSFLRLIHCPRLYQNQQTQHLYTMLCQHYLYNIIFYLIRIWYILIALCNRLFYLNILST